MTTPSGVSRLVRRTRDAEAAMTDSMSLYAKAASSATPRAEGRTREPYPALTERLILGVGRLALAELSGDSS